MKKLALLLAIVIALAALHVHNIQAQGGEPKTAGLDQKLDGITIRMSVISGIQYDALYKSIPDFEKATGAKVQIVSQLDGFNIDKKQTTDFATNAVDYDESWNHTTFIIKYHHYFKTLHHNFPNAH